MFLLPFVRASIRRKLLSIYFLLGMAFENEGTVVNKPAAAVTVGFIPSQRRQWERLYESFLLPWASLGRNESTEKVDASWGKSEEPS